MTEVAEAETIILRRMQPLEARKRPLAEVIDLILREDIHAERDQPPFDRVTMDGIAVRYEDWVKGLRHYRIMGTQGAGSPPLMLAQPGECVEIMTGAMLPQGADTVIPVERLTSVQQAVEVEHSTIVSERQFVHPRGSDRLSGSLLMSSGQRLGPAEMAVLASAGRELIRVTEPPRVAVVSTGDELVDVGEKIAPYQIRSSNDRAIEASLVRHCRASVTRVSLKDDPGKLFDAIKKLHESNDVLILSGGVSMGQYDFVPGVLQKLGVEPVFHRIEQRPGRPMWFGVSSDSKPVFALPGNPVSTLVCLARYVIPALLHAMGLETHAAETVKLAEEVRFSADLVYFLPVTLSWDETGSGLAKPCPTNTSGDFVSLAGTQGFVELPKGHDVYAAGTVARLFRW